MTGSKSNCGHDKFKELAALATVNALTTNEWTQLTNHTLVCEECEEVYQQYRNLVSEAIPLLAFQHNGRDLHGSWNDAPLRKKLFNRIKEYRISSDQTNELQVNLHSNIARRIVRRILVPVYVATAACIIVAVGFVAYRLGREKQIVAVSLPGSPGNVLKDL